ncbi:MAG: CBS domain-containing protein [Pseudomonadales bacterium]|nr:CBS domain-containing protein [Pseudomonadales bacterium]
MKRTARDILKDKGGHMVTINSDATVYQALTVMTQNKVGSIVVVEDEKIVGIWTERDLMFRVLEEGFDPKTARLRDNMSVNLISANVDEAAYQLYDKFLGRRIRHLLIEEGGEYIGILSVGDVLKTTLQQATEDLEELNQMVSLEYYENWKEIQSQR